MCMQFYQLAAHYTSGMIFQRNRPILIEGKALTACEITATLDEDSVCVNVRPGAFSFALPPRPADRGLTLTITANSMRNGVGRAAPENAKQAFSGGFAAIGRTDFELIRYSGKAQTGGDSENAAGSDSQDAPNNPSPGFVQTTELTDIYIGEVWLAGGQSNMQWPLHNTDEYRQNPVVKENSDLRFYTVGRNIVSSPAEYSEGYEWAYAADHGWVGCDEESALYFSAVAYHFAHTLYDAIKVPIGIINCNVGGSSIFAWIPCDDIKAIPEIAYIAEAHEIEQAGVDPDAAKSVYYKHLDEIMKTLDITRNISGLEGELPVVFNGGPGKYNFHNSGALYNSMLKRVSAFPIRGMLWYQGETESSCESGKEYAAALEALVNNMKRRQQNSDFAFNYVQLAPFGEPTFPYWATVCDQMRKFFLHHPDYAMVTIGDVGCAKDIHPPQKRPVGERLAYAAMHRSYDLNHEFTGPVAESAMRLGDEVRISFIHGAGLHQRAMNPGCFELAYEDGAVHAAVPEIRGEAVYLPLPEGPTPEYVRYEFVACPQIGLFNSAGYPASLFELPVG